ncbi:hypothetical protein ACWDR4_41395, partial [Streptomyces sp. NPDC000878]
MAAVPLTATAAAIALKAGTWELPLSRHAIRISPMPRQSCPDYRGASGWGTRRGGWRARTAPDKVAEGSGASVTLKPAKSL